MMQNTTTTPGTTRIVVVPPPRTLISPYLFTSLAILGLDGNFCIWCALTRVETA